jgi:hypothetical protein
MEIQQLSILKEKEYENQISNCITNTQPIQR